MKNPHYINDKLRSCPCYDEWQRATQLFIARNAAVDRLNMNRLAAKLATEFAGKAYQPGPRAVLP